MNPRLLPALLASVVLCFSALRGAEADKQNYNLPAGEAATTLRQLSETSHREILFSADAVRGVRTQAVQGEFTALEASNRMLAGTGLQAIQDDRTGGLAVRPREPVAPMAPAPSRAASIPTETPSTAVRPAPPNLTDDIVTISPFEVTGSTKGYYSSNTMSGTRFNTKLEDLASSVTVVTKEQMSDFAMIDLNDIFLYTANTEGSGTYTDFVVDRSGQPFDNVQLNPTQANRVRGLSPANISLGNTETMGRVPVDPLAIDSVEISRGPNANVFGLGNPSGTVNMVPSSANLTKAISQVLFRVDSYGGYRTSLDLNRVLLKNKLAVRASGSFQHEGFERKPSGMNTVRYNGMIKYQPFKNTTLSGSFSYYRMNGNRPNFTPPRDGVSFWVASGKPSWDPIAEVVHVNGTTLGPFTTDTGLPIAINRAATGLRNLAYVDQTGLAYWSTPTSTAGPGPTGASQAVRLMSPTPAEGITYSATTGTFSGQPLFATTPSVTNKALYDWTSINLAAPNRLLDQTESFSVQLDHLFLRTQRQTLAVQVSYAREDAERYKRTPIGDTATSGLSGQLQIDVNERRLDGSANPFFGRPYIYVASPIALEMPARWDTTRAQLAYRLDLTKENTWLKWLGLHELTGYDEFKYRISRRYGYRDTFTDSHSWIPTGAAVGNDNVIVGGAQSTDAAFRNIFRYYLGDANGSNVDHAPGEFKYGPTTFTSGSYTIVGGLPVANSGVFRTEPAVMGRVATTDNTGGGANSKQYIKSQGGVIQSHFFSDRLVTTFGLRRDYTYAKSGSTPQKLAADGLSFDYESINHWAAGDYMSNTGLTKTAGVVVRPFKDWGFIQRGRTTGSGPERFFASLFGGLAFTLNKSDSFLPATPAQDIFLRPLPNPSGNGKDYGIWLNMFDDKLVVRVNRYENKQINSRNGEVNTLLQRVTRIDTFLTDAWQLKSNATAWITAANPTWSQSQISTEVSKVMGLSQEQLAVLTAPNPPLAATNDITAKGTEVEVNFNPSRHWTVAFAGAQTESINSNISRSLADWIAFRMPVWTSIIDPRFNTNWWTRLYTSSNGPQRYFQGNVEAPYNIIKATEGQSVPQVRKYSGKLSTSYQLSGLTEHRILKRLTVGGALRWEDKGAIGYYGKQLLPAVITALDPTRPIYDKAHYFADVFVGYRTKLFADRVGATFRLNVRNLQESGDLQPIGAFPDGTPHSFRIVDPRQFIFSATFDL